MIVITTSKAGHDNDFICEYQKATHLHQTQFIHLSNPTVETLNTKGSVWRNRKLMNSLIKGGKNQQIVKEAELSQCFQLGSRPSKFISFKDFVFSMDSSLCDIASKSLKKANAVRKCLSLEDEFEVLT